MTDPAPSTPTLLDTLRGWADGLVSFMGRAASYVGEIMERFGAVVYAAEGIARRYRWGISTSWPLYLLMALGDLAERGAPYHEFESALMEYYSRDNWREVESLVASMREYVSVSPLRRKILRDTVLMIRAGERDGFNAASFAVPTMFAQLEGILREYGSETLGLVDTKAKSVSVKRIMPALVTVASQIERPALNVITNLLFKSYKAGVPPRGQRFNRHLFNHGRATEPGRISYVVRLLLMIDLVAYLIDRARDVDTPAVRLRASWADTLSSATQTGATRSERRSLHLGAATGEESAPSQALHNI